MGRVALLLLVCAVLSSGHVAYAQCGTVLECRATRAAIDQDIAVQLQSTRESIRATAAVIATERAESAAATAQARALLATQTAQAQPTATTLPTSTPQPTAGPSATATATPLPTATERPSAIDRLVDRILTQSTPTPNMKGESTGTPFYVYFGYGLIVLFLLGAYKMIFGQQTIQLPPDPPQTWRNDDDEPIE